MLADICKNHQEKEKEMYTIRTPYKYVSEAGIAERAGALVAEFSKKPLVIAGAKARKALGAGFFRSLAESGVSVVEAKTFEGYPSERQFSFYADEAKKAGADAVIGIGGGRVLDTAKAAADTAGLPAVTVPTVAATCAAWAALSIQYDDAGSFVQVRLNKNSARLVIADPKVIFTAPERYLFAGVVDTFAKFFETRPTTEFHPEHIPGEIAFSVSKTAYSRLEQGVFRAVSEASRGEFGEAAGDTVDSIIHLAGLAGSVTSQIGHYSFAHPFYHTSTKLTHTNVKLHGEKVAFGIVAQLVLEGKPEREIVQAIRLFAKYSNAFTLDDFNISGESRERDLDFLARQIPLDFPYVPNPGKIRNALVRADELTRQYRREHESEVQKIA